MKLSSLALVFGLFLSQSVFAAGTNHCTGLVELPTSVAAGNCTAGECMLDFPSQRVFSEGSCDDGQGFSIYADVPEMDFQSACSSGVLSGSVNTAWSEISWQGSCSKGKLMAWNSAINDVQSYLGSCQNDGGFYAQIQSLGFNVTIECDNE